MISIEVFVGRTGDPRQPVVDGLHRRGVFVHPTTVSRIRSNDTPGTVVRERDSSAQILEMGVSKQKYPFYLGITQAALEESKHRKLKGKPRIEWEEFLSDVAKGRNLDPQVLRRCLKALELDMISVDRSENPNSLLRGQFYPVAEEFLYAYSRKINNYSSEQAIFIGRNWDRETIYGFYDLLSQAGAPTTGAWRPYEAEVLNLYCVTQESLGSHLTPFDWVVLEGYKEHRPIQQVIRAVKEVSGFSPDEKVIEHYRGILVMGHPLGRQSARQN